MTKEEALIELKGYRKSVLRRESLKKRLYEIESDLTALKGNSGSERIKGAESLRIETLIDKVWVLKEKIVVEIMEGEILRERIEKKISALEFPYDQVLTLRFIVGCSYEEMSNKMSKAYKRHYSYGYLRYINTISIKKYANLLFH